MGGAKAGTSSTRIVGRDAGGGSERLASVGQLDTIARGAVNASSNAGFVGARVDSVDTSRRTFEAIVRQSAVALAVAAPAGELARFSGPAAASTGFGLTRAAPGVADGALVAGASAASAGTRFA